MWASTRCLFFEAGVRVAAAASAARIISVVSAFRSAVAFACCSVCCSAAFSRRDGRFALA
ncbi:MAG: hypothetical protein ACLRVN_03850 [Butyricicoccus sp.]